jgi:hypothetical protein
MTAAPPIPADLKSTLEELRASVAARGKRRGMAGAIQEAVLGLLSALLTMLEGFRAGRLLPVADGAEVRAANTPTPPWRADSAAASPTPQPVPVIPAQSPGHARGGIQRVRQHLAELLLHARSDSDSASGAHWIPAFAGTTGTDCSSRSPLALRASPRPPRFKIMTDCGLAQHGAMRPVDAAGGPFFKNAPAGERINATLSFQHQNDAVAAPSSSIFS